MHVEVPPVLVEEISSQKPSESSENWTVIGDIPEYSFSSEPLIDENTTFTMNVDPFDPLMLTAVTTNGWTVEYFAAKDQMGAPVVLTGFHAQKDDTGEYLEMKFDGEGHPISIEQQGNKKVILNWENYTIYGEKEWTVVGELPDFSSIPSPVVDDQAEILTNTDPSNPLWLTVTTNDGWVIKYFAEKDAEGSVTVITFVQAEEIAGGNIIKTKMDNYGLPVQFSVNDGKVVTYDWTLYEVRAEDGMLQPPTTASESVSFALATESSAASAAVCAGGPVALNTYCNFFGYLPPHLKPAGTLLGFGCGVATTAVGAAAGSLACPPSSPELDECLVMMSIGSNIGSAIFTLLAPATGGLSVAVGIGYSMATGLIGTSICNQRYGNSSGDPHLRTFDGLGYDFQAVGEFVYIQSTEDPTEMTVQIRQESSKNSKHVAWNTAVAMSVGGDIVEINGRNNPPVSINRTPTPMENKEVIHLKNGCKIYAEKQSRYLVIWKDNTIVDVGFHDIYFAIRTSLPDSRKGLVKGLLGNSDGDKANDLQTRDGSIVFDLTNKLTKDELYNQFGNSWRITQEESLFTYAEGEDTATYTDLNFPYELVKASDLSETVRATAEQTCRDAGITDPLLLEDCILDVGMTSDSTFADNMKDLKPPEQSITVTDDWLLYGNAQKAEGDKIIHITPDERWKTGMALREGALNVDGDFEKTFNIYMGDSNSGADGMVFIMLPALPPEDVLSAEGGDLGFNNACNGNPCLGVEIDTYGNSSDPSEDHIALIRNGSVRHNSTENQPLPVV
ncbi:MAG: hypothetical protein D3919_15350, partial [Candidatus Electrothrix sp. AW5]|nr:hypothetical protein [Candidatus Electrothrix gigas]